MAAKRKADRLLGSMPDVSDARADYHMANRRGAQTRRRKGVPSQGAGADYHYRSESDWLWMSELAWDMYRNNMIIGSIVDRAIENQLQGGFRYRPNTGDEKLDIDLKQWWTEVSEDPKCCDPSYELTFAEQEEMVLRATFVAGDVFGVPMEDGTVEIREGHLCRSPARTKNKNIVHGVEYVPNSRRRAAYHFIRDEVDPNSQLRKRDLEPILAWDDDGERNVFHSRFAKRASQTRGITAFTPIFDVAGYHDDVQFLKMVQARAASLFVFVRERANNFDPAYLGIRASTGVDVTQEKAEQYEINQRQFEEVAAGSTLEGLPGEKVNPWSANIPNPEFFPHAKLLLMFMGNNLGMPLVMSMMDASEGNFSSYRGAVDQARLGFRKNQRRLATHWHNPVMRFKLFKKAEDDPVFRRMMQATLNPKSRSVKNVFRHSWTPPSWPYIQPVEDATADVIRSANSLASMTKMCDERGTDWEEDAVQILKDRKLAMRLALQAAVDLKAEFPDLATDIDTLAIRLFPLPTADKTSVTIQTGGSLAATENTPPEAPPSA